MAEYKTIPKRRRNIIKYFIFILFIIPTIQVSGLTIVVSRFIPNPLGYNLLAFILSVPLWRSFNKNYGNLKGVVFAIAIDEKHAAIGGLCVVLSHVAHF